MATGKLVVAWMTRGGSVFGRMWRPMRRRSPAPSARAATTNSRSRSSRKLARVNRANAGAKAMPIAIMLMATPGANTAEKSSAERIAGNPCNACRDRHRERIRRRVDEAQRGGQDEEGRDRDAEGERDVPEGPSAHRPSQS